MTRQVWPHAAAGPHREPQITWRAQIVPARDQFEGCTLTVEQWLALADQSGFWLANKASKWRVLIEVCAVARSALAACSELRQEPRVGYDPVSDQPFFIFKADNNGTTVLVSPGGIRVDDEFQR
jgi:hypothetical protein